MNKSTRLLFFAVAALTLPCDAVDVTVWPGFDFTNVVVSVSGAPGAQLSFADSSNAEVADGVPLAPAAAYSYDVRLGGASVASGAFATGGEDPPVAAERSQSLVLVDGESLPIEDFAFAASPSNRVTRTDMSVALHVYASELDLVRRDDFTAIMAVTNAAGIPKWHAWNGEWLPLEGHVPQPGVECRIRAVMDFRHEAPRTCWLLSEDGGETYVVLRHGEDAWIESASSGVDRVSSVRLEGLGEMAEVSHRAIDNAATARFTGEGGAVVSGSLADALSRTPPDGTGTVIELLTNVTWPEDGPQSGEYLLALAGHSLANVPDGVNVVAPRSGAVERTYVWTGAGTDRFIDTPENWERNVAPDFDLETPFVFFAGGGAAVLDQTVSLSGIAFAGDSDFELAASAGRVLLLGGGGISNAPAAVARTVTVSAPVMPFADQVWQMETNTAFTLSGVLRKYGTATPTVTMRQGSFADPAVNFAGAAAAEGAGDFAGDIVFEETALPDGHFGTAHVRASGFEPFGPGGTLKIRGQGVGHDNSARVPRLALAGAVVSKAVEYGECHPLQIYAEDNTTNVMNGAFTPFRAHETSGSFPPDFNVGCNAVLRLAGDMDFGTRISSDNDSIVSLGSTAGNVADMPTGTIAFDGRITRLPRSLKLDSPIRLEFNAVGNAVTNLVLRHGTNATAVVSFGVDYALGNGQAMVTFPNALSRMVDFDLNGTTQHIAGFAARTSGNPPTTSRILSSGAPGTLRVSPPFDMKYEGKVAANATLKVEGPATLKFTRWLPFLSGSALELAGGRAAFTASKAELGAGVSSVDLSQAALILSGGSLSLPAGTTLLDRLYCGGGSGGIRPAPRGFYSSGSVPDAEWEFIKPFLAGGGLFVRRSDVPSTALHVFFMLED